MPKSKKSKKTQNWFYRLFSGNTKNNVPLSKKKNIAKKWCKNQKYRGSPPGRCSIQQNLCKCEDDGSQEPINSRFKWKFGYKSIKSKKINYKKMKV